MPGFRFGRIPKTPPYGRGSILSRAREQAESAECMAGRLTTCLTILVLGVVASLLLFADPPTIRFIDIAAQAGLTIPNTFGGKDKKDYILESTGTGAGAFQ